MRHLLVNPALLLVLMGSLTATPAPAQSWDPVQKATGWSRVDSDGSCTFFDPSTQTLQTWSRDGGVSAVLGISKAGITPERWVLDSQGNAWLVAGTTLQQVEKNGKPGKKDSLPLEIGDLAWDAKGFLLCYRSREPYLEKRDYKTGQVIWSYGTKPAKGEATPKILHRIAVSEEGNVLLASGSAFSFLQVDGQKGKALGQTLFTFNEAAAPSLALARSRPPTPTRSWPR